MSTDKDTLQKIEPGMSVTYTPEYGEAEKGIVKSLCNDPNYVFVVYSCAGNWGDYKNYTAARTHIEDLKIGW